MSTLRLRIPIDAPFGTVDLVDKSTAVSIALALLAVNLLIGAASLAGLGDSCGVSASWKINRPISWKEGSIVSQETPTSSPILLCSLPTRFSCRA